MTCVCTYAPQDSVWGICVEHSETFHFGVRKKKQLFFPFQEALVRPENDAVACGTHSAISNGKGTTTTPTVHAI